MSVSQNFSIKQNFHESSETMLNNLVNKIFTANYTFHAMSYYFDRVDIALIGFADFYRACAIHQYQLVRKCMDYIVLRGGEVHLETLQKPDKNNWGSPLEALEYLLKFKQSIVNLALKCHDNADKNHDPHLTDFLETEILRPFASAIRKVGVLISNCKLAGPGLGEYQLDKHLKCYLEEVVNPNMDLYHLQSFV